MIIHVLAKWIMVILLDLFNNLKITIIILIYSRNKNKIIKLISNNK